MKKYVAILKQEGGCDYTIGCGIKCIQFEAENAVDAGIELKKIIFENYNHDESILSSAFYVEVANKYEADIKRWYAEFEQIKQMAARENEKNKELAELERLRKKYNQ